MLNKVKLALRINNNAYDEEILDLINACKRELELCGIVLSNLSTDDEMITQAIILYCKANFGFDNDEAQRFLESYNLLKMFLCTNQDYIKERN